jgi:endonuclease YncB( thermonuclease family)
VRINSTSLAFALACIWGGSPSLAEQLTAIPRIVDADTVELSGTKVRLNGIDAPESDQRCLSAHGQVWNCGIEATSRLRSYSHDQAWTCELSGTDRYRRSLGTCSIEGSDVGRWLVRNGLALAFRRYSIAYVPDEDYAREHELGLWIGAFIAPWDWRHRGPHTAILGAYQVPTAAQRDLLSPTLAATPPSPDCVIKGNLKSYPQCIYHVPGGRFYDQLKMEPTVGRRWFCSEADAQAAGCRKSKL